MIICSTEAKKVSLINHDLYLANGYGNHLDFDCSLIPKGVKQNPKDQTTFDMLEEKDIKLGFHLD